ncbi:MAG: type II-A CRISPR-associated protein Csn2 [Lachnospiraceae bacterium]|nr:type II-A CRISPR-associated protein Csn2 [Lachnospiraceae bacterium]
MGIDIFFEENKVNVLVIENPIIYTKFLENLMSQIENGFILLSEGEKRLQIHKCTSIIHSPLCIDLNNKKILSYLYKEMKELSSENFFEKENVNSTIISYLEELIIKVPYPVTLDLNLDEMSLYKLYNVRIEIEELTLMEKIIYYIQLEKMLCKTQLLVFVNLKAFFSSEQLQEIYKMAFYNKISILLLEFS